MIESLRGVIEEIILRIMNIPFEVGRDQKVGSDIFLEGVRFDGMGIGYTDRKAPGERFAVWDSERSTFTLSRAAYSGLSAWTETRGACPGLWI